MLSCDTLAIRKTHTAKHEYLFAKNSDRPLGEAQLLYYEKGARHAPGTLLKTTGLTIPQAENTYSVLGSRPYWIWGFEMGVNERGVAIGNEAQGSKNAFEPQEGLLGMDLLRLGLERGATAREALEVITALLKKYGQNANASPLSDRRYENSFLIADAEEIWLLETAGREWAARRVEAHQGISNCYAIRGQFDLISENAVRLAEEKGWSRPDAFDFAESYTLASAMQSRAAPRFRRLNRLLSSETAHDFDSVKRILRDHFEGELLEPRMGAFAGTFSTICMHACTEDSIQTAASWLATRDPALGPVLRCSFSMPCISAYIPVYLTGSVPRRMTIGGGAYNDASLWWRMERLAMLASLDEARFVSAARMALGAFEARWEDKACAAEEEARAEISRGRAAQAHSVLNAITEACSAELMALADALSASIAAKISADGLRGPRADFLRAYAARVGMPLT